MKKVAWLKIYIEDDATGKQIAVEVRAANNKKIHTCFYYPGRLCSFDIGPRERARMENDIWDFLSGKEGQLKTNLNR